MSEAKDKKQDGKQPKAARAKKPSKDALLAVRAEKKAKQPKFVRHAWHRKIRLNDGTWRRPRGLHNKMRLRWKSRGDPVEIGWRSPSEVRGLSKDGKKIHLVSSLRDMNTLEPEIHALVLASSIGNKKRLVIMEEAKKQGFKILNIDVQKRVAAIKADVAGRAKKRTELKEKKSVRDKAISEKAAAKEKQDAEKKDELTEEEKRKAELQEQQKVLTQKEQ